MILLEAIRWNYLIAMSAISAFFVVFFAATGNNLLAVLLATSLIVWWGYIPGFTSIYLKELSMGDFFAVILVPHFGAFPVAVWGFFNVLTMMLFGKLERPIFVVRGAIVYFVVIMLLPFLIKLSHGNILIAMYWFTIIFYAIMGVLAALVSFAELMEDIKMVLIAVPLAFASNTAYLVLFGPFTNKLAVNGMKLDATMITLFVFIIVAVVGYNFLKWYAKKAGTGIKERKKVTPQTQPPDQQKPTYTPPSYSDNTSV